MTADELKELVHESWVDFLLPLFNDERMRDIQRMLASEVKQGYEFYPEKKNVFRAFKLTPLDQVKVVIIGQDPYIRADQATGLAFAVPNHLKTPPSLRIIFQELERAYGVDCDKVDSTLEPWAEQGVLLLNTALTVRKGKSNSHAKYWAWFTETVLEKLQDKTSGLIFIQWGKQAQSYPINTLKHWQLKACHPQAQNYGSAQFVGNGHFQAVNAIIEGNNGADFQINWF